MPDDTRDEPTTAPVALAQPTHAEPAPNPLSVAWALVANKYVSTAAVSIVFIMGGTKWLFEDQIDRWLDIRAAESVVAEERVEALEAQLAEHLADAEDMRAEVRAAKDAACLLVSLQGASTPACR